jgi:chitinase
MNSAPRQRRPIPARLLETLEPRLLLAATPSVTTADVTVHAGAQSQVAWIPITLSRASVFPVIVHFATQNVTAAAGADYTADVGSLTFQPGQRFTSIPIQIAPASPGESDKAFNVVLLGATGATLTSPANGARYSRVAISNSNAPTITRPWLRTSHATSGPGGWEVFNIQLSAPSQRPISLRYQTVQLTATHSHYTPLDGVLNIAPGSTTAQLVVRTKAPGVAGETAFGLRFTAPTNVRIARPVAYGKILASTDLSDNLHVAPQGEAVVSTVLRPAAGFTTGSSASVLASISVPLRIHTIGTATLTLHADNGGVPGALVGTLTSPSSYSPSFAVTTFGGNNIALTANTSYWVVMEAATGDFGVVLAEGDTGIGVGFTGLGLQSADSGGTWSVIAGGSLTPKMQVLIK